jgi:hypothetical protein
MNIVYQVLEAIKTLLKWWFIVEPWEQAIRVRFGKHVRVFEAGAHFRIPYFDAIYVQNTRRRVMAMGCHTMTTADNETITVNGSIGYKITDILKLHLTLHDAESVVSQEVQGLVAKYVAAHPASECTPQHLMECVNGMLPLDKYGLGETDFFLQAYVARVPAFRLIQDTVGGYASGNLSTSGFAYGAPVGTR